MTIFASILVPLDGSETAAASLGCATWLASRLGARLHILSATPRELPAHEELRRLHVAEEHWPVVELHQAPAYPPDAILAATVQYDARLVVMTARGASSEEPLGADGELATTLASDLSTDRARNLAKAIVKIIGHVTQSVIERSMVPVLLLPPRNTRHTSSAHSVITVSTVAGSIVSTDLEYLDGVGVHPRRPAAGALHANARAEDAARQPFGHLAAGGVGHAEEQEALGRRPLGHAHIVISI